MVRVGSLLDVSCNMNTTKSLTGMITLSLMFVVACAGPDADVADIAVGGYMEDDDIVVLGLSRADGDAAVDVIVTDAGEEVWDVDPIEGGCSTSWFLLFPSTSCTTGGASVRIRARGPGLDLHIHNDDIDAVITTDAFGRTRDLPSPVMARSPDGTVLTASVAWPNDGDTLSNGTVRVVGVDNDFNVEVRADLVDGALTFSAQGLPAGTYSVLVDGESSIVCEGFSSCFFQFGSFLADFPLTIE
jgi:hypothetical protein